MSPRAAWRLETLGFERVYDYVEGKADWLARGLPRAGTSAGVPYAGDLLDPAAPTCDLSDDLASALAAVEASRYGFCLVVNEERILLGRLRRSALEDAAGAATVESLMEPGPSTVRPAPPRASWSSASPTPTCGPRSSPIRTAACSVSSRAPTPKRQLGAT